MRSKLAWRLVALLIVAGTTAVYGQRFGRRFIGQNEPPATEFIFARLHYAGGLRFGGSGWSHDYPDAEEHLTQIMSEATGLNVKNVSYRIVELGSKEVFDYPFAYISEPGEMDLTEEEAVNLRQYIDRGGFVMIDDFDGPRDLANLRRNLEYVFPDREMVRLSFDHEIFHMYFDIDRTQVTSPYDVGAEAVFYGLPDSRGHTSMIICHNNDIGDFWEWIDQPQYALKPSIEGLRLGINFVLYAMTH